MRDGQASKAPDCLRGAARCAAHGVAVATAATTEPPTTEPSPPGRGSVQGVRMTVQGVGRNMCKSASAKLECVYCFQLTGTKL